MTTRARDAGRRRTSVGDRGTLPQAGFLYGRQCVRETLLAGRRTAKGLMLAEGLQPSPILRDIVTLADKRGVAVHTVPRQHLLAISEQSQGVALEVGAYPYSDYDDALAGLRRAGTPLVLVLDNLQDPQNLGTLLRTADAVACDLVVMPERRQVPVTPAVSHASVGAVEHLRVAQVVNLRRALGQMREAGLFVCGLERSPDSRPAFAADLTGPLAIVVGSESEGLRRLTKETCDFLVELPMLGHVSSLNAAVAGSVLLYEVMRQRSVLER